jgi:hypothetical protein
VVDTGDDQNREKADRVAVDKKRQTVRLFDKSNSLIGFYPATVGSEEKPSHSGTLKVTEIDRDPIYRYNPAHHFKGVRSRKRFTIKPGPNNPVVNVWINLSAESYGIHGTPFPGKISKAESHGCVRLTNWDADASPNKYPRGRRSRSSMTSSHSVGYSRSFVLRQSNLEKLIAPPWARRFTPATFFLHGIATKQICGGFVIWGALYRRRIHVRLQLTCGLDTSS